MKNSKIKVLFLITDLDLGGAETQLFRVISKIDRDKFIPIVVSMKDRGVFADKYDKISVKVYCLNVDKKSKILGALLAFTKIVKKEKPDILQTFMYHADIFGRVTRVFTNTHFLISSIRTINFQGRFREKLYKYTSFLSNIVTTNSYVVANYFIDNKLVNDKKIKVIYNGIDIEKFNINSSKMNNDMINNLRNQNKFIWLAVGRLEIAKDYKNMICAFKRLVDERLDCFLFIAGEGQLRNDIQKLIKMKSIEDRVELLGRCDNINELLSNADAYVLSSSHEGLPNSVIEACVMEVPVVSTDVGGVNEIITNEYNGFLCEKENDELLYENMKKMMLLSEVERNEIGKKSKKIIQEKFEISSVVHEWECMYIELQNSK